MYYGEDNSVCTPLLSLLFGHGRLDPQPHDLERSPSLVAEIP